MRYVRDTYLRIAVTITFACSVTRQSIPDKLQGQITCVNRWFKAVIVGIMWLPSTAGHGLIFVEALVAHQYTATLVIIITFVILEKRR